MLIAGGGYFGYQRLTKDKTEVRYVTTSVERGTLIVSVSGSGQVAVSNQSDVKPKAAGEIVYIGAKKGQAVKAGALFAQIDTIYAEKAVRDAETSLETAELELEELLSPPDELTLMQAENSLTQAKESKQKAEDNIKEAYEDGFNNVANVFLDLPAIMAGLYDIIFSYSFSAVQQNIDYYADSVKAFDGKVLRYRADAYDGYQIARKMYEENFQGYKSTSRFSERNVIESLISQTYETAKNIAEAVKSINNLIQFYQDKLTERILKPQALSTTHLSNLNTYTGKTGGYLLNLLSIQRSIQDNKEAVVDAERTIKEKELSLAKLKAGAGELEIRAKKIAVQQKKDALTTAKLELADCYIYIPFDGIIAEAEVNKGDVVSTGAVLASIISPQKMAEISLNEIDIAKVKTGQKATITFDALEDLSITGEVAEVDILAATTQGVVNYGVKIAFDTQDERVKPGMSLSASIITDIRQNALLVPNSAVKQQDEISYVQMAEGTTSDAISASNLWNQPVQPGLSSDTMTEIIDGLQEGDLIVTQTIDVNPSQSQSQQSGGFVLPGMGASAGTRQNREMRIMLPR